MKCPLKPIKIHKNKYDSLCGGRGETYEATVAKIETDFGDCDLRLCMAYDAYNRSCKMMIGENKDNAESRAASCICQENQEQ